MEKGGSGRVMSIFVRHLPKSLFKWEKNRRIKKGKKIVMIDWFYLSCCGFS